MNQSTTAPRPLFDGLRRGVVVVVLVLVVGGRLALAASGEKQEQRPSERAWQQGDAGLIMSVPAG